MTAITNFPNIRPSLLLDFANSGRVDPRITFQRASSATYFDDKGLLRAASAGVPRIDYDPVTGECRGLLVEEQRTNLLKYSEQFDNAAWTKNDATVTPNSVVAPDGTLTADKLIENTLMASHQIVNGVGALASATPYTATVYAKNENRRYLRFTFPVSTPFSQESGCIFDLLSGSTFGAVIGSATGQITYVGNGWYRCSITATTVAAGNSSLVIRLFDGMASNYTGDGTSGLYIWGAQVEVGAFPTSYIPTTDAQVTRAADSARMTGTNFTSWYRQGEGTFVAVGTTNRPYTNVLGGQFVGAYADIGTRYYVTQGSALAAAVTSSIAGDLATYMETGGTPVNGDSIATAFAYKKDNFAFTANGFTALTDNSGDVADMVGLYIGGSATGSATGNINGHLRRIAYYPRRITNEQLQALTAI